MHYTLAFLTLGCICNMIGCGEEEKPVTAWEVEVSEFDYVETTEGSTGCNHHHYSINGNQSLYINEHHHPDLLEKIREAGPGVYQVNYQETEYGNEIVSFYAKD